MGGRAIDSVSGKSWGREVDYFTVFLSLICFFKVHIREVQLCLFGNSLQTFMLLVDDEKQYEN